MEHKMNVQIDQRKVAGVVIEASRILADKGFNRGEIILGLAELIGRVIVDTAQTDIQAAELSKVAVSHMSKAIEIGVEAGKSSIVRV
jgi:hypothetical protein